MPSAPPKPEFEKRKLKNVLNAFPGPSGIRVVEKADPACPKLAGVTRSTPAVHAALPLICNAEQLLKLAKLNTVAAWAKPMPSRLRKLQRTLRAKAPKSNLNRNCGP